jgi:transcription-repair coupling factor (superfamily II helicase)
MRRHPPGLWLVLTEEAAQAEALLEDIAFFYQPAEAGTGRHAAYLHFPEAHADSRDMREAFQASSARLAVLSKLRGRRSHTAHDPHLVVITTPAALLQPVPPPEEFAARELELRRGQPLPFAAFQEKLREFDYDAEAVCEAPGQYAVRGGIVDVYPLTATQPSRLDFFGDTLEDIRALDPVTQRSGDSIERIVLTAAPKLHAGLAPSHLTDHFQPGWSGILLEPKSVEEAYALASTPTSPPLARTLAAGQLFGLGDLDLASDLFDGAATEETWDTESLSHHRPGPDASLLAHDRLTADDQARARFLHQVAAWKKSGYTVTFLSGKEGEEQRLRELLDEHGGFKKPKPTFLRGHLAEGFRVTWRKAEKENAGEVFVTETEIFGRRRLRRAAQRQAVAAASAVDQLLDFAELADGDLVVHLQHGVAVYRGLTRLDTPDGAREVISLEFDDRVTLHVPLTESHLISRYVGLSKVRPQLGRIGTGRWEKTRQAAERATPSPPTPSGSASSRLPSPTPRPATRRAPSSM